MPFAALHTQRTTKNPPGNPFAGKNRVTKTLGVVTFAPGQENWVWPAAYFDGSTKMPFAGVMLSVPEKYDEVLTKEYGDYMKIPENKNGSLHTCYFDPDKPYTAYAGISEMEYAKLFENYCL